MKNLQISYSDLEGRRFNGYDLKFLLRNKGIDSRQIVWKKLSSDIYTEQLANDVLEADNLKQYLTNYEKNRGLQSVIYPFSYELFNNKTFLEADIVHYQLLHSGFFSYPSFPALTYLKPTVYSIHDPWVLTGHCIHPLDCERYKMNCGDCPDLSREFMLQYDTTSLNKKIKEIYLKNSRFEAVVASKWMQRVCKESDLFSEREVHVIPYGIDTSLFKTLDKETLKQKHNIKTQLVISFRASAWKLKSLDLIRQSLLRVPDDVASEITIITFDEKDLVDDLKKKFKVIESGFVTDENEMAELMNCSDIFLMPSLAESFGLMALESMACGNTVIVFKETATEEIVEYGKSGITVDYDNSDHFYKELTDIIKDDERRKRYSEAAKKNINDNYRLDSYVNSIIELYKYTIEKYGNEEKTRKEYIIGQLIKKNTGTASQELPDNIPISEAAELKEIQDLFNKGLRYLYFNKKFRFITKIVLFPLLKRVKRKLRKSLQKSR